MISIRVDSTKVRKMCSSYGYYTFGCTADFEHLLNVLCDFNINQTEESIKSIATDIYTHSYMSRLIPDMQHTSIRIISQYILNGCCSFFIF